jgi:hypothetical protein
MEVTFYQSFQQWAVTDGEAIIAMLSMRDGEEQLARQFAASGDLLEACKEMLDEMAEWENELGSHPACNKASAAIAKAEGTP